jgi:hypothetical protein
LRMSLMGQKLPRPALNRASALHPKADTKTEGWRGSYGPEADMHYVPTGWCDCLEVIVEANPREIGLQVHGMGERVGRHENAAGGRAECRYRTKIDEEVFGLDAPLARQAHFDAAAHRIAGLRNGKRRRLRTAESSLGE